MFLNVTPAAKTPERPIQVQLNAAAWFAECKRLGLLTDGQRADAIGVSRPTVSLVQNGRRRPGNEFIAGVMRFMAPHRVRFEDIFTWGPQ